MDETMEKMQFAVLIDADNISSKYTATIFEEMEKYGFSTYRRIYGNWSRSNGWDEEILLEYSIIPVQQFSYTTGKNATDMAMVIDAMDILYKDKVQGFCLVTSDSDFTRLAMRLREENKFVIGMGESKTPLALTRACNKFIHLNLISEQNKSVGVSEGARSSGKASVDSYNGNVGYGRNGGAASNAGMDSYTGGVDGEEDGEQNVTSIAEIRQAVLSMLNANDGKALDLGQIGARLNEKFTDFDVRNYGYSKLSVMLSEELPEITVTNTGNRSYAKKASSLTREELADEIYRIIRKYGGTVDNLSVIHDELRKKHKHLDYAEYGFSRISTFLRSLPNVTVNQNQVSLNEG